eukprot:gene3058-3521_t
MATPPSPSVVAEDKDDAAVVKLVFQKGNERRKKFNERRKQKNILKGKLAESKTDNEFNYNAVALYGGLTTRSKSQQQVGDESECNEIETDSLYEEARETNGDEDICNLLETTDFDMGRDSKSVKSNDLVANSESVSFKLDPLSNYIFELMEKDGISPANEDYTAFCVVDFAEEHGKLKERSFFFVVRKPVKFEDSWSWVYACTCKKGQTQMLETLSQFIPMSKNAFEDRHSDKCLHLKAASHLLIEFDSRNNIEPESHSNSAENDVVHTPVYSMSYDDKYVIVWEQDRNMFGVVSAVRNHLSCSSCPNSSGCAHVSILTKLEHSLFLPANAERILESIKDNQDTSKIDNQSLLSWQTIPFNNVKAKEIRNTELQLLSKSYGKDKISLKPIVPGDINCTGCGSEWSRDDPLLSNWIYKENVKLYMDNGIFEADVYQIKCSNINCRWVLQYDGLDDGLLNMGSYLVSHRVLKRYMLNFLHGRMPIYVFHMIYIREKSGDGYSEHVKDFTYNKFKNSWYCYLSLLDIDIDKGFQCEICKEQPSLLIMDATSLSFRKELSHWKSFLQDVQNADSDEVIPRCSKFTDRIMIRDKQCRSILLRYADSHRRKKKPLSADEFEDLLARIRDESTEIFDLMHFIQTSSTIADHSYAAVNNKASKESAFTCPKLWVPFIEAIGCSTPVCGFVHQDAELLKALQTFIDCKGRISSTTLSVFQERFPVLYALIISFHGMMPPNELIPVLTMMIKKAENPFLENREVQFNLVVTDKEDNCDTMFSHWPAIPRIRNRGVYAVDKDKNAKSCLKISRGHPSLLPGIFTMFCEHGK